MDKSPDALIFREMLLSVLMARLSDLPTDDLLDLVGHLILRERFKSR